MAEIGQAARTLIPRPPFARHPLAWAFFPLAALVVALASALAVWHFTVDDALISIRYARHVALGAGYRFNLGGAPTDGVTPLPWPFLLWPIAHAAPLFVLTRAKALGLAVWLASAAFWGRAVGQCDAKIEAKLIAMMGLGFSMPLAAHAVSGMETAVATCLATTAALSSPRPCLAAVLAGLAASLRPELTPWALALAALFALPQSPAPRPAHAPTLAPAAAPALRVLVSLLLSGAPFLLCCVLRAAIFGNPAPLAVLAKPSDLAHGVTYAVAAALVSVGPLLAFASLAAMRERGPGRAILVAGLVHLAAVAVAGGDWMPFARLVVPIVPSLLYASVLLSSHSRRWVTRARALVALGLGARTFLVAAPSASHVEPDREALIAQVTPLLDGRKRVASVDIGWVSAATEADILDLAGVTDPQVAALAGGHTSKRIDASFLLGKEADVLLLYAEGSNLPLERWSEAYFPRVVEARLARSERVGEHFAPTAFVRLGATGTGYYVLSAK